MVRMSLLFEAIARGLRVSVDGDRLVVRGPRRLEPLARELLAHKNSVMTVLSQRPDLADVDPFMAEVLHVFDGELLAAEDGPLWSAAVPLAPGIERWEVAP